MLDARLPSALKKMAKDAVSRQPFSREFPANVRMYFVGLQSQAVRQEIERLRPHALRYFPDARLWIVSRLPFNSEPSPNKSHAVLGGILAPRRSGTNNDKQ